MSIFARAAQESTKGTAVKFTPELIAALKSLRTLNRDERQSISALESAIAEGRKDQKAAESVLRIMFYNKPQLMAFFK